MAPSRGKGKARAMNGVTAPSRRTPRSTRKSKDDVPEVYQDLLAEAEEAAESSDTNVDRPLKKRKVVASVSVPRQRGTRGNATDLSDGGNVSKVSIPNSQRTVEDSSESADEDSDDESDLAFEDVDLDQPAPVHAEHTDEDTIEDISISVDTLSTPKRNTQVKRIKPISAAEKSFRVLVHKAHILCLLGHCMYVNGRCNNEVVQRQLRAKLSKKTISYLNPRTDDSQFQRNRSFMDGLQQASEAFRGAFQITGSGMRRARWPVDGEDGVGDTEMEPMDRAEFIAAAKDLEGSQDTANQLFCAMLRSVGVKARLVCSLQVLPILNVSAKSTTPQKFAKHTVYAMTSSTDPAASDAYPEDVAVQDSSSIGKVPSVRRRLGHPTFTPEPTTAPTRSRKKKPIRKLSYPIFWTEAFNTAQQKWIPVDPIITQTINKPSKIEPPSSYELNQLSYVFAFESDGTARDVTRRYARAYNAKTRRLRVESTDNGAAWLKKALRVFRRQGRQLDREQVEDAELAQREAREGLPGNVQDFKDHPYYALERHLKRHEVIHPRREVGKVNAGTAAKPRMEAVYRREDVCVCRSAEKWFRAGRIVQKGEQPVKRVPARRARGARELSAEGEEGEEENVMQLYALFQTELYVPPPVLKGKVPRNAYGNLDIYVPSMVPARGAHIRHQLASQAARILKVDYADAVTGFQFRGRHGTAIVEGAVVAEHYADAVRATIEGLEDEKTEEESKTRSAMALRVWRRFLTGLRIKERVSGYGDSKDEGDIQDEMNQHEDEQDDVAEAGGFFRDDFADDVAMPTAGRFSLDELSAAVRKTTVRGKMKKKVDEDSEEEAEYTPGDEPEDPRPSRKFTRRNRHIVDDGSEDEYMPDVVSPVPKQSEHGDGGFLPDNPSGDDMNDGGFLTDDIMESNEGGGGFLPEINAELQNVGHENGGGFLAEEDGSGEQPLIELATIISHDKELESGGGFLSDEFDGNSAEYERILASQTTNANVIVTGHDQSAIIGHESINDTASTNTDKDANSSPARSDLPRQIETDIKEKAVNEGMQLVTDVPDDQDYSNDESDRGSMLSHDPEDEDAEPDWLEMDSD